MYGGDLADLYRGDMTLRQAWLRIKVLIGTPGTPLEVLIVRLSDEDRAADDRRDFDNALAPFLKGGQG